MTQRPLISIVTPTLNQGRFIEATIGSIRRQTYANYEHIVVDGGSTDDTLDILRRLEGTYPMRWLSEPDGGMYDAINKGMRLATGDVVAYLNSDDLYFPWTLEVVAGEFARRPAVDFVHGDVLNVDDETGHQRLYLEPPFDRAWISARGSLAQPAVFWRRAAHDRLRGFDPGLRFVADLEFWIRAGAQCSFRKVNECLAVERDHRGTLRAGNEERMAAEIAKVRADAGGGVNPSVSAIASLKPRLWFRLAWLAIALESGLPSSLRRFGWRRWLDADQTRIARRRILSMVLTPGRGRPFGDDVLAASRRWLDPPL